MVFVDFAVASLKGSSVRVMFKVDCFSGVNILICVGGGCIFGRQEFHTLCRSVVLNIVSRSGEFTQTRGRNMGGRLHWADMSPKLVLYW